MEGMEGHGERTCQSSQGVTEARRERRRLPAHRLGAANGGSCGWKKNANEYTAGMRPVHSFAFFLHPHGPATPGPQPSRVSDRDFSMDLHDLHGGTLCCPNATPAP